MRRVRGALKDGRMWGRTWEGCGEELGKDVEEVEEGQDGKRGMKGLKRVRRRDGEAKG